MLLPVLLPIFVSAHHSGSATSKSCRNKSSSNNVLNEYKKAIHGLSSRRGLASLGYCLRMTNITTDHWKGIRKHMKLAFFSRRS
jgi:hypothetical protein